MNNAVSIFSHCKFIMQEILFQTFYKLKKSKFSKVAFPGQSPWMISWASALIAFTAQNFLAIYNMYHLVFVRLQLYHIKPDNLIDLGKRLFLAVNLF